MSLLTRGILLQRIRTVDISALATVRGSIIGRSFGGDNHSKIFYSSSSESPEKKSDNKSPLSPAKSKILRTKTPIGKLDELEEGKHPFQEKEPLPPWPDNTNPNTGEVGGPKGPEPTRYGDWERKGRVTDF